MFDKKMITISQVKYDKMVQDLNFLSALQAAGVDNWSGYEEAQNIFSEENDNVQ